MDYKPGKDIAIVEQSLKRTGTLGTCVTLAHAITIIKQAIPQDTPNEHFVVLGIDEKYNINFINTIATGNGTRVKIDIKDVFTTALLGGAAGIILGHNHPDGSTDPSEDDMDMTIRLWKGCQILGIDVVDHIIVGKEDMFSFLQQGWMKELRDEARKVEFPEIFTGNVAVKLAANIEKLLFGCELTKN